VGGLDARRHHGRQGDIHVSRDGAPLLSLDMLRTPRFAAARMRRGLSSSISWLASLWGSCCACDDENHSEAWGGVVWVPLSQGSPNSSATAPEAEIQWILNETQKYHLRVITVTISTLD
jgi:hypothetical protein